MSDDARNPQLRRGYFAIRRREMAIIAIVTIEMKEQQSTFDAAGAADHALPVESLSMAITWRLRLGLMRGEDAVEIGGAAPAVIRARSARAVEDRQPQIDAVRAGLVERLDDETRYFLFVRMP